MTKPSEFQILITIATGSALGAIVRYYSSFLPKFMGVPSGTLLVNIVGSLLLGLLMGWVINKPELSPLWKLGLGTGFLGAFTTFSTFSVENVQLLQNQAYLPLAINLVVQILGGFSLAGLGLWLGQQI